MDYDDIMGVPVTFLQIYNPSQFEILGLTATSREFVEGIIDSNSKTTKSLINGKGTYARVLIRKKAGV